MMDLERCFIITGADKEYFYLAQGLILSLLDVAPQPIRIGFLDLGCTAEQLSWLRDMNVEVASINHSSESKFPKTFRAIADRPNIHEYFPGYDIYLWIDADAWVQRWETILLYLNAASEFGFAVTPEIHRSYSGLLDKSTKLENFMNDCYFTAFDQQTADLYKSWAVINTGVCAFRPESVLREGWQEELASSLMRTQHFMVELASFNKVLYSEFDRYFPSQVAFLPAICNWMCHQSTPLFDEETGLLCEPSPPYEPIGIVHLTTDLLKRCGAVPVRTRSGDFIQSSLLYMKGSYSTQETVPPAWHDSGWAL